MNIQYTNPKLWGPHFWFVFNCVANTYPENPTVNDIANTKTFYTAFQNCLPCVTCRESYIEHCNMYPIDNYLSNKIKLIQWVSIIYQATNNKIINEKKIDNAQININIPYTRKCLTCNKKNMLPDNIFVPNVNQNFISNRKKGWR